MLSKILPLYKEHGPIHQLLHVDVTPRRTSRFFFTETRHAIVANVIKGAHHQTRQDAPCEMSPPSNGLLSMPLQAIMVRNYLFLGGSDKKQTVHTFSARLTSALANGSKCK
ncbi:hypothetical protein FocTR4_00016657 [Fusarium oxysporum f. sp. cubense]|uniref:Uncharacterized protein n=1 Tax=Fusarium oxysporum f. sp. cubense TaxID=61366 RepID=A0A5C6SBK1_FUSOC|nr:hypothetical protein FocTR4_00016657 [Fusarium oxysporum f. sp. cubense]